MHFNSAFANKGNSLDVLGRAAERANYRRRTESHNAATQIKTQAPSVDGHRVEEMVIVPFTLNK